MEYGSICGDSGEMVAGAAGDMEITGDHHQNNLFVCRVRHDFVILDPNDGSREGCKVVTTFYDGEHFCEYRLLMTKMTNIALQLTTTSVDP